MKFIKLNYGLIIILLLITPLLVTGQKTKTVRARGSHIARDLTPEQTRTKAIENAKRNALIKAGVSESVSFTDFSYKYEDNEKFQEIFQAISAIQTGGEILVNKVISEERSFNEFGNMVIEVEIEATIFKHKEKADPRFLFLVEGIDEVYKNKGLLKFTFTPTQDGYLKIFNVTDEETYLLYPYIDPKNPTLNEDPDHLFKKRKTVQFPIHPAIPEGYETSISTPGKSQEFNILIFVYTKENIPFIEDVTFKNMMKWIYSIPPDKRVTAQYGFVIKKNN